MNVYPNQIKRIIICETPKREIDLIMDIVLKECGLDVYGYNNYKKEYWGRSGQNIMLYLTVDNYKVTVNANYENLLIISDMCAKISGLLALYEGSLII